MEEYVAEVLFDGVPLWLRGIVGEDYIKKRPRAVPEGMARGALRLKNILNIMNNWGPLEE